jgi:hypothetical protein
MFAILLAAALAAPAVDSCAYDRAQMRALDERSFDQDMDSGWRVLELKPQCRLIAADLIRDYRHRHHGPMQFMLFWHEGQLRAEAGQTEKAIGLFDHSRRAAEDVDWNLYVDGTVAFLKHDRDALQAARDKLAHLPRPAQLKPVLVNGQSVAVPWPPNLNVLDGLLKCFDQPYEQAYGPPCTQPLLRVETPDR